MAKRAINVSDDVDDVASEVNLDPEFDAKKPKCQEVSNGPDQAIESEKDCELVPLPVLVPVVLFPVLELLKESSLEGIFHLYIYIIYIYLYLINTSIFCLLCCIVWFSCQIAIASFFNGTGQIS
jgi:hypothetical protein